MEMSRYRVWLALVCLLGIDIILRISMPALGADLFQSKPTEQDSSLAYSSTVGYEPKPFAACRLTGIAGIPTEYLNSEGSRGPDYITPKPYNTYRILAVGDSVVQGFSVLYGQTWTKVLEDALSSHAAVSGDNISYEVINAGVGGYVSWQIFLRLKERGLKYGPDLVLVFAGWNDMLFSSLPFWAPEIELSKIEKAWSNKPAANKNIKGGLLKRIRR